MITKRPSVSRQIVLSLVVIALTTVIVQVETSDPSSDSAQIHKVEVTPEMKHKKEEPQAKDQLDAKSSVSQVNSEAKPADPAAAQPSLEGIDSKSDSEANKRKGRAEPTATTLEAEKSSSTASSDKAPEKETASPIPATTKPSAKPAKAQLTGKSGPKSKLSSNLGTVTSTGSGGPTHYMSKHDSYSAIAEKHGALAQDAMRKSDKRHLQSSFGGIQKASGIGDVFGPFKGVTDSGLARTLGASMRSIMKSKYSVPAYVASALLGAVALLAFYESPISPLPVPPLPEPPVGRFPPDMPNISPNLQVPYRINQQQQQQYGYGQNFNQRSQGPQVLFPGSTAQQRQAIDSVPVQLTNNLLSLGSKQNAQRKSSPDYEQPALRSFFGGPSKINGPINPQKSNTLYNFFGLGASGSTAASLDTQSQMSMNSPVQASPLPSMAASSIESKVQQGGLSNSHLVNKVKYYFNRSPTTSSSSAGISNSNPYDQYQSMSLVQALMKDTAFIPRFLSPTRKSSHSATSSKIQSIAGTLTSQPNPISPASRMQVSDDGNQPSSIHQMPAKLQAKQVSSGYSLMRAADRIAHVLAETFTSGVSQRNSANSPLPTVMAARKSSSSELDDNQSSLLSATSLISNIMSSYNMAAGEQTGAHDHIQTKSASQTKQPSSQEQQQASHQPQQQAQNSPTQQVTQQTSSDSQANARSLDHEHHHQQPEQKKAVTDEHKTASSSTGESGSATSAPQQQTHVRKVRSTGIDYPLESNQELHRRDQQPSKATQINNLVDFVSDSYSQNRLLFNFVMNQVGLSHAVPYVEQILAPGNNERF